MTQVCQVWAILNVTPDSFSDGGKYFSTELAVKRAQEMIAQGASVIDVGGESTRPGAERVSLEEECARVLPVVEALVAQGVTVSVDTMRAEVARQAIALGTSYINDVSGGKSDPEMYQVIADSDVDYVVMHWRGHSDVMNSLNHYEDVVHDVVSELRATVNQAIAAGIPPHRIIVDPGLGFSKDAHHNWEILRNISTINSLGYRVLVGASRKRFLAECVADNAQEGAQTRDDATAAVTTYVALHNVWAVRVHEVSSNVAAIKVAHQLQSEFQARN